MDGITLKLRQRPALVGNLVEIETDHACLKVQVGDVEVSAPLGCQDEDGSPYSTIDPRVYRGDDCREYSYSNYPPGMALLLALADAHGMKVVPL